jgi:Vitamin K epoxide reductase family
VRSKTGRIAGAAFALIGVGFSAWLTYLEAARIHAWCQWCIASATVMTLLAITLVWRITQLDPPEIDLSNPELSGRRQHDALRQPPVEAAVQGGVGRHLVMMAVRLGHRFDGESRYQQAGQAGGQRYGGDQSDASHEGCDDGFRDVLSVECVVEAESR